MIKTLRESKAKLSALVDHASKGEEVIITVHGKPKARLVSMRESPGADVKKNWAGRVRADWEEYTVISEKSDEVFQELRGDRI